MKNIHLIPTDKPTGIFDLKSGLQFSITEKVRYGEGKGYHIYITSDEEIMIGDKGWLLENNGIVKDICKFDCSDGLEGIHFTDTKIILTTDLDLITDGVQAIDDEFLEWFAKNPNCDSIPIITTIVSEKSTYLTNMGFERWRKEGEIIQ